MKCVGIDFSKNSPAICIYDSDKKDYTFHAFHQYTKTDKFIFWADRDHKIRIFLDQYPYLGKWEYGSYCDRYEKYNTIAEIMFCFIRENTKKGEAVVWIEDYNYNPKSNRNNIIDIVEATTFLKVKLLQWFSKINSANIATVKKAILGRGDAEKSDAVNKFLEDLKDVEGLDSAPFDMFCGKIGQHLLKNKSWADKPFQDVVDAWTVCRFGLLKEKIEGETDAG